MDNWYKFIKAGMTRAQILTLIKNFLYFEDIFSSEGEKKLKELGIKEEILLKIREAYNINIDPDLEKFWENGIRAISVNEKEYPEYLRNISQPPVYIYVKGRGYFSEKSIGVVGTRRISEYGRSVTEKIVEELVNSGVTIVSGLAVGIDRVSHEKCLKMGGNTVAVVGSGLDIIYPYENRRIWEKIGEEGLIVSEYPLGFEPSRWSFPERNRIIAGLSRGIFVAESYKEGGALITAKIAQDESREVFTVPGNIFHPSVEGNNMLIRKNIAISVNTGYDIIDEFSWDKINIKKKKKELELTGQEEKIYMLLSSEKGIDELVYESQMSGKEVLIIVTKLEIRGIIRSISGGRYKRTEY